MRQFVSCIISSSPCPAALCNSGLVARSALLADPLMNLRGVQSAPAQSRGKTTAAPAGPSVARFQSHPEGEIHRRRPRNNAQFGRAAAAGGGGSSDGSGEERAADWGWNQEQQQQGGWRTERTERERRSREWRAGGQDGSVGGEEAASRGLGGTTTGRGVDGRWGIGGGRGQGRFDDEHRYWCSAENVVPAPPLDTFVMLSYNILADKNAEQHYNELYWHIPRGLMNWSRRKSKLVQELGLWSPDIMCLQEVDKFEDLREEFERRGYQGAYQGRTGGARDGCAVFWKTARFRLLQEESIQFNKLGLRDNVAQLCVFQSIARDTESQNPDSGNGKKIGLGNLVIVGNIHVLFNPKRGDVKLGQVRVLLDAAHELSEQWGGAPVTIGGDFNSTPMSDLYRFVATSKLDLASLNRSTISGQEEEGEGSPMAWMAQLERSSSADRYSPSGWGNQLQQSAGPNSSNRFKPKKWQWTPEEIMAATGTLDSPTLRHNLKLRSAYSQIKGEFGCRGAHGEPLLTTFHRKFIGTVDYIWHTEGIDTLKVLDTVPVNVLQRSEGLPSQKWGSDHLALACELAFLPGSEPGQS